VPFTNLPNLPQVVPPTRRCLKLAFLRRQFPHLQQALREFRHNTAGRRVLSDGVEVS
jgi:hypothetical protein